MLHVSVLGQVEVTRDGQPVRVPAGKTVELLVRLAIEAGSAVRTDRLIEDLWADDAMTTQRNTLQSKVARLRRALGDPGLVASVDDGYALVVDPSAVDALALVRQASEATERARAGDDRGAAAIGSVWLDAARGDVLAGAGDAPWVQPHRARVESARLQLIETGFAARARLGETSELVADLERAVAEHPYQESLWALLVTVLYRSGRQADALAAYGRVRSLLADELGLEPGPELRALELRILQHDGGLRLQAAVVADGESAGNLPSMSMELVGRDGDAEAVLGLLADERLVEIVGPGGIGKTALAIAIGRRIGVRGGVWLVRLEGATAPDEVVDMAVAALNVVGGEAALFERLKTADAVVVLDNCEHVRDAAADLAVRILDEAPSARVLCTTQVPLDVEGEVVFELAPLGLADSVDLFVRRSAAQRRGRPLADADQAVEDLCRSLDGLPLAIELAAARTKTLSVEQITRRLDDRFEVLNDPSSRKSERRRALRATIRWSYELLFPDDQRGLWALAAFAGGAALPAIEFVLASLDVPPALAIDVVDRLAGRSLVIVDDVAGEPRYRLLDSIRAFALEALTGAGLTSRALDAHAAWYAAAASTSTAGVRSGDQAEHLAFARAERANIDAALAWCAGHDPRRGLDIVNGFGWAWIVLGDSRGADRARAALAAVGNSADPDDRATALLLAGWIDASTGHLEIARQQIDAAEDLAALTGDVDLQARCSYYLAYVVSHQGDFAGGLELTERSRRLYDTIDRPWDQAANALFATRAAISAGDEARAVERAAAVQRWLHGVRDPWLHVRCEAMLGELARLQRRFDDAVAHIGSAAATSHRLGFRQTEAYQVSSLGRAQCQAGDYEHGAATLQRAVELAEAIGDVRMAALARVHLGRVLRALGRDDGARAALEAACAWHRDAGGGEQAALGECLLAAMDAAAGDSSARGRLAGILDEARGVGEPHVAVFALDALARLAAQSGDAATARALAAEADRCMDAASHFIAPPDRVDRVDS